MGVQLIDQALLRALSDQARERPRRRLNHNFHAADDSPGHRLLNAVEPGSYLPPHRHQDPSKGETMVALTGRLGLVVFGNDGEVTGTAILAPGTATLGVDIAPGTWHTVLGLEPGTVMLEAKAGPYRPLTEAERAPWAPAEGAPEVPSYYAGLLALFP